MLSVQPCLQLSPPLRQTSREGAQLEFGDVENFVEIQIASCAGSSCSICNGAPGAISCSSISSDSGFKSVLVASKQRQRASRKSQNGSFGNCPWAAPRAASRNVV